MSTLPLYRIRTLHQSIDIIGRKIGNSWYLVETNGYDPGRCPTVLDATETISEIWGVDPEVIAVKIQVIAGRERDRLVDLNPPIEP